MWCQNLPGLVPRDPGSPQTRKVVHWLKGGEWALLKLLLLTRQSAEHGAVEPKRNELPSFRERRGLSIVPKRTSYVHRQEEREHSLFIETQQLNAEPCC